MYYRPSEGHGLPHDPFSAIVSPRPIAWISSRDGQGRDNLAPYSFFNAVAYKPPQVMFASTSNKPDRDISKDSVSNINATGVFCINIVEYAMRDVMNQSSGGYGADQDEFTLAEVERAECDSIACSRVALAPASLECRMTSIVRLDGAHNYVVFGEVTGVHLRDDCLVDGVYDVSTYQPLARLGYRDYTRVSEVFSLKRPGE